MVHDFQTSELQRNLAQLLSGTACHMREVGLPAELATHMERLADQVDQPCVVAVVGRVKAGKSTFINALLGEDLAKVGTTETTATINYLRYGQPEPGRPVRCYWRSGQVTDESREFLDNLQGNDIETLRRSEGIHHLEFRVLNPYLERVTLVDTPGTGAAVDEHQNRTAEFMSLYGQLRERHDQETRQIGNEADAVIYLVGPTARAADQDFLDEFHESTQGRSQALNAIGVLAKVDISPAVMESRVQLAAKIATQLLASLNTVVPVSAGLQRALDHLLAHDGAGLTTVMARLRRIPPATLNKLLDDPDFYLQLEPVDCPVTPDERRELLGDMPWMVFTTVARVAADTTLEQREVVEVLRTASGFVPLQEVLEQHFLKRSQLLRCFRIVDDARLVLSQVKFKYLPEFRRRDHENTWRLDRFIHFIEQANGDSAIAQELMGFVRERLAVRIDLETVLDKWDRQFEAFFLDLQEYNADFEALQRIEKEQNENGTIFSPAELDELRALLGLYGLETEKRLPLGQASVEYVGERQQYWSRISLLARNPARRHVAQRAVSRYGLILASLLKSPAYPRRLSLGVVH